MRETRWKRGGRIGAQFCEAAGLMAGKLEKISDLDFTKHRLMYLSQLEHEIAQAIAALKDDAYTNNFRELCHHACTHGIKIGSS